VAAISCDDLLQLRRIASGSFGDFQLHLLEEKRLAPGTIALRMGASIGV
jgi:hypothetical protein